MARASSMSGPEPEPAEGQVPAGHYEPVPQVEVNELPESDPKTENTEKSINEVAKEVIAGRWGRGQKCKQRLQAAGYDVAAVSEEVKNIFNQKS